MAKVYRSMREIEKDFQPINYQKRLARLGAVKELVDYSKENGIEIGQEVIKELKSGDLGSLTVLISLDQDKLNELSALINLN